MSRSGSKHVKALLKHCRALKSSEQQNNKSWSTFVSDQCKTLNSSASEDVRKKYEQQLHDVVAYLDELDELERLTAQFTGDKMSQKERTFLAARRVGLAIPDVDEPGK